MCQRCCPLTRSPVAPLFRLTPRSYNHEFAIAQFQEVLKLDDKCAMAWWGIAYGVSSNYNWPPGLGSGFDAISAAVGLKEGLTDLEVDLIDALATRHSEEAKNGANPAALSMGNLPELNAAFAVAMKAVYEKVRTRTVFYFVAAFSPAPRAARKRARLCATHPISSPESFSYCPAVRTIAIAIPTEAPSPRCVRLRGSRLPRSRAPRRPPRLPSTHPPTQVRPGKKTRVQFLTTPPSFPL